MSRYGGDRYSSGASSYGSYGSYYGGSGYDRGYYDDRGRDYDRYDRGYDRSPYGDRYREDRYDRFRDDRDRGRGGRGGGRDRDRDEPTRVYIGNLASRTRDRDVQRTFDKYGPVSRVDMKNGFCFIEYNDRRDADDCVRHGDGIELDGKRLAVEFARGVRRSRQTPVGGRGGGYRVKVEGMSSKTSWQDLKDFARKSGCEVAFTDVWMDRGKKYGVIEFQSADDARKAVKELDNSKLDDVTVHVLEDQNAGKRSSRSRSRGRSSRGRSPRRDDDKKDSDSSKSEKSDKDKTEGDSSSSNSNSNGSEANGDSAAVADSAGGEGGDSHAEGGGESPNAN